MNSSSEYSYASAPSIDAVQCSLIDSAHAWLDSYFELVVQVGRAVGTGLAPTPGFGVGATVLLIFVWFALVACVVAALVENDILGWTWSLLRVALLNFAGAVGLMSVAIKCRQSLVNPANVTPDGCVVDVGAINAFIAATTTCRRAREKPVRTLA